MERDGLAGSDVQLIDRAGARRAHLVLHLHRLQHQQGLPGLDLIANLDKHACDLAGDRCLDAAIGARWAS
jgi:hypothetical protein